MPSENQCSDGIFMTKTVQMASLYLYSGLFKSGQGAKPQTVQIVRQRQAVLV
ncbi:hypothetical protein [Neisseria meningitidis]|uniref:hypothetical protein n=1 Tax=Neisseria meningitidis TaxID=487 RepID=UPI00163E3609|nr:hypothetical protein [Neisseria meningitidis]